jgi:hypothetical protein
MRVIVLFLGALLGLASATAFAQGTPVDNNNPSVVVGPGTPKEKKDHAITVRDVKGIVVDESGSPIEGALVSLTDLKTNRKLTFITKKSGRYNFDSLSLTEDYDVSAKKGALVSAVKHLSQYDRSTPLIRNLELGVDAPAKSEATPPASSSSASPAAKP